MVAHELFLYVFTDVLRKHGFVVERSQQFRIKNLEPLRKTIIVGSAPITVCYPIRDAI